MTSKELVLNSLYNREVPRTPWVPFVGCHAAKLLGIDADEYLKSADKIVEGVCRAAEEYRPDGLPAVFDLQIEAEALGCKLQWSKENPPTVVSHPLEDGVKLSDLKIPGEKDGRFPIVLDATRRICEKLGDRIAIYGLITGPYTLALHLLGTEIFYLMADDPDEVHRVMEFCKNVCIKSASMYMDAGADIIAVVDPMTSQISPDSFEEYVTPYASEVFKHIKSKGKGASFFVCGNAKANIENMCKCAPNGLSIDENIPLDYVREICQKYGLSFGGNIKLTLTMLFGSPSDNINDARECMLIGGTKGFILSPGCDMPFATPEENVKAVTALVLGEVDKFMETSNVLEGVDVTLPDYSDKSKVYLDIITLDSASCAPCQYMMEAVYAAAAPFREKVEVIEHKIKFKEGVVCMLKLGVKNIPTIVIDGVTRYVSIIPDVGVLKKDIEQALKEKGIA